MTTTLQFLLLLGIVIFAAKAGGLVSTRLGQPAVLGELLVGVALGPSLIDLLHQPAFAGAGELVIELGELGVIFLMFIAGLEVDLDEMLKSGRVAILAGTIGVLLPLLLGTATALLFQYPLPSSIFIGLVLTATSVSISAQTLLELGFLSSKEGLALLGAAVIDDVLGLLLLSLFLAFTQPAGGADALTITAVIGRMILFFVLAVAIGLLFIPRAVKWVDDLPISEGIIAFVVVVTLFYAWAAEAFGQVAAITGAFIAGALFARTTLRRPISDGMHTLTYAFFVPIFLISIGLRTNARSLGTDGLLFASAIIAVAIAAKIVGCWLGARMAGFSSQEALRVAVGMISRGEVGLIIAAIGLNQGLIDETIYASMVVMVIVTTLITPLLLRRVFPAQVKEELIVAEGA
jgi:Kef-type K+ transport system membrane component KefB